MKEKIRVSAVSYKNSVPFIYGLKHAPLINEIKLSIDAPAICAEKLQDDKANIGLVPVGALPSIANHEIISEYCISSSCNVRTVVLVSEVPLSRLTRIFLDPHSRTSIKLAQVLAIKYWGINPQWVMGHDGFEAQVIKGTTGAVVIGDKTFDVENKYPYQYDLAAEWHKFTGLPFVFAVWVANKKISNDFIARFNEALRTGISHIKEALKEHNNGNHNADNEKLEEYLTKNISFVLDAEKKKSMALFLKDLEEYRTRMIRA